MFPMPCFEDLKKPMPANPSAPKRVAEHKAAVLEVKKALHKSERRLLDGLKTDVPVRSCGIRFVLGCRNMV